MNRKTFLRNPWVTAVLGAASVAVPAGLLYVSASSSSGADVVLDEQDLHRRK